jgi:glucose/mannose-6-phosphate isomerase
MIERWSELQKRHDPGDMYGRVVSFPGQMEDAWRIGAEFASHLQRSSFSRVVVCGMGGSAIGGDMAGSFLGSRLSVPVISVRDYTAPLCLRDDSLVIISSYSGNTAETLSAHESLRGGNSTFLAITSGGKLEERCRRDGTPVCRIPGGMPPRSALGYSLLTMLQALRAAGACEFSDNEYAEALDAVRGRVLECATDSQQNPATEIAERLRGNLPFVYAGPGLLAATARRWAGQLSENGKTLAHFALYPELNHNEIVGWQSPPEILERIVVVSLEDRDDHAGTRRQTEVGLGIIEPLAGRVIRVDSGADGRLARMLSTVVLGDFVSVYLGLLEGADPTPVEKIDYLKSQL